MPPAPGTGSSPALPATSEGSTQADIAANLSAIHARIEAAARRAGRDPASVRLMAVSKTKPPEAVLAALAAGQTLFGENRVQEAVDKIDVVAATAPAGAPTPEWHLIGHLQSNKARFVPGRFSAVQSVDSPKLAESLNEQMIKRAPPDAPPLDIYLQLNWDGEDTKSGVRDEAALDALIETVQRSDRLRPRGFMAIPSPDLGEAATRGLYEEIRELLERSRARHGLGAEFDQLSLGMSHDFEWAIECGATLVRVGTAIFGARS